MAVYETDEIIEKVILVGVAFDTDDDTERSLDELRELAKTAGAQTVGRMIHGYAAGSGTNQDLFSLTV